MNSAGERPSTSSRLRPNSSVQVSFTSSSRACRVHRVQRHRRAVVEHAVAGLALPERRGALGDARLQGLLGLAHLVDVGGRADEADRLAAEQEWSVVDAVPAIGAVVAANPRLDHPFRFARPHPAPRRNQSRPVVRMMQLEAGFVAGAGREAEILDEGAVVILGAAIGGEHEGAVRQGVEQQPEACVPQLRSDLVAHRRRPTVTAAITTISRAGCKRGEARCCPARPAEGRRSGANTARRSARAPRRRPLGGRRGRRR